MIVEYTFFVGYKLEELVAFFVPVVEGGDLLISVYLTWFDLWPCL